MTKLAFLGSIRLGSGVIVVRQDDGSWSPPASVMTTGVGFGGQIGMELADLVFILRDQHAVHTFLRTGTLMLSGNLSAALGPFGRSAEAAAAVNSKFVGSMYTFSKTRGIFGGVSVEGGMLITRNGANREMYGESVSAEKLLSGKIAVRDEVEPLARVLAAANFHPRPETLDRELALDSPERPAEVPAGAQNQPPAEMASVPALPAEMASVPALPAEMASVPALPAELHAEPAQIAAELPAESNEAGLSHKGDQVSQPVDATLSQTRAGGIELPEGPKYANASQPRSAVSSPADGAPTEKGRQVSPLTDEGSPLRSPETAVSSC